MKTTTMEQPGLALQSTQWRSEINGVILVIGMNAKHSPRPKALTPPRWINGTRTIAAIVNSSIDDLYIFTHDGSTWSSPFTLDADVSGAHIAMVQDSLSMNTSFLIRE